MQQKCHQISPGSIGLPPIVLPVPRFRITESRPPRAHTHEYECKCTYEGQVKGSMRSLELSRTFLASDLPEFGGLFVTSDPLTMDTWPRHYENLHAIDDCTA